MKKKAREQRICAECGASFLVLASPSRKGRGKFCSKSCGIRHNGRRHGHSGHSSASRTYTSWALMVRRCTNPRSDNYARYGGRGITVCERWKDFRNFLADMGERPADTSLDRINPDGNYEAGNCRWATAKAQQRNMRATVKLTHNGETKSINDWAEQHGMSVGVLSYRLRRGWPLDLALSVKPRYGNRPKITLSQPASA